MSRSNNSQSAAVCYEILKECQQNCSDPSMVDVIIVYTTSLYYNDEGETAWNVKRRLTSQMVSHKAALDRLIKHGGELQFGVRYMSWEEIVLQAPDYQSFYQKILQRVRTDSVLRDLAVYSIGNREVNDASISFLVEETVVAHILRQRMVPLPKHHVQEDRFRLLVYPGPYIALDLYQWKRGLLPQHVDSVFGGAQYNAAEKVLYVFDDMPLPAATEWQRELRRPIG